MAVITWQQVHQCLVSSSSSKKELDKWIPHVCAVNMQQHPGDTLTIKALGVETGRKANTGTESTHQHL